MHLIESRQIRRLLEHVAAEAPELLTACRWLAFDPKTAVLVLGEDACQPTAAELARLVERLIVAGDEEWSHPTEILGRPCPDFAQLLAGCLGRLATADGDGRQHLGSVREKLELAVRLETKARRRRAGNL